MHLQLPHLLVISCVVIVIRAVCLLVCQSALWSTLLALDEVNNMIDDVIGSVQQLECDLLAVDVRPGDVQGLHDRINTVKVCLSVCVSVCLSVCLCAALCVHVVIIVVSVLETLQMFCSFFLLMPLSHQNLHLFLSGNECFQMHNYLSIN